MERRRKGSEEIGERRGKERVRMNLKEEEVKKVGAEGEEEEEEEGREGRSSSVSYKWKKGKPIFPPSSQKELLLLWVMMVDIFF